MYFCTNRLKIIDTVKCGKSRDFQPIHASLLSLAEGREWMAGDGRRDK
jgi:hypothetical protein